MGQAKRRGTFEQRVAQSCARFENERNLQAAELKARQEAFQAANPNAAPPPRRSSSALATAIIGMALASSLSRQPRRFL